MHAKTALLIALGLAIVLPYVTIALLEGGGSFGVYLVGALFIGVAFLVAWSDFGGSGTDPDGR